MRSMSIREGAEQEIIVQFLEKHWCPLQEQRTGVVERVELEGRSASGEIKRMAEVQERLERVDPRRRT